MALPDEFSEWEHLQSTLRTYHNKLVREEFADIEADDALEIPRGSLKIACLLKDDDTVDMTILRMYLLFFHARKAQDLQAPVYGIPVDYYDELLVYKPQINFYFKEDEDAVTPGRQPVRAELSIRLLNETEATLTEADAKTYANKIKTEFGAAGGYRWRKGRYIVTYRNKPQGAYMKLFAYSEAEAREVINKVLDITNKTLDDDFLTVSESKKTFIANPGTHLVYGKQRNKVRERPIAYVRFVRATLHMRGLAKGVCLYDRTGYFPDLVR